MDTTTALAFVIPISHQSHIDEVRAKYDAAYKRWMPHINFVFPFVSSDRFDAIVNECKLEMQPFEVTLNTLGWFAQGKKGFTFHLTPDSKSQERLKQIYLTIASHPTIATLVKDKKRHEFHPHLTIAQCKKNEYDSRFLELQSWLGKGITVTLDELSLLKRSAETNDRMTVVTTMPLKKKEKTMDRI
jgi:2'-5' RNA ligase